MPDTKEASTSKKEDKKSEGFEKNRFTAGTREFGNVILRRINNMIFNTLGQIETDSEEAFDKLDSETVRLLDELGNDTGGQISSVIHRLDSLMKNENKSDLDKINQIMQDKESYNLLSNLYLEEKGRIQIYDEIDSLMKYIPQLFDALEMNVDAMISSDDFTTTILSYISCTKTKGTDSSKNTNIDDFMEIIQEEYDVENKFEKIVTYALKYGRAYALTMPYQNIFQKYIDDKIKSKNSFIVSESTISDDRFKVIQESIGVDEIYNDIKEFITDSDEDDQLKKSEFINILKEFYEDIEVYDNNILPQYLSEARTHIEFVCESSKEFSDIIENAKKNMNKKRGQSNDGFIETDKEKLTSENIDVKGCVFDVISPKHIIPIKAGDTILGYYHIEANSEFDKLKKSSSRDLYFRNTKGMNEVNKSRTEDKLFNTLANLLIKKLDKKFIEDNVDIKRQIYDILKYNDNYKKKLKITFIDKEFIEEFEVNEGEGMFGNTIFLARIYLSLIITNVMIKLTKGYDTTVYYVKEGVDNDIKASVDGLVRSLQNRKFNFDDIMGSINRIFKIAGTSYSTMIAPIAKNGERPFDMEVLSGQDTQIKDDFIEQIGEYMLNTTGTPSVLLNYTNEVDYVKTLVQANAKFAKKVIRRQRYFNPKLTKVYRKIAKFQLNNKIKKDSSDNMDEVLEFTENDFKVVLPQPKSLINSVMQETISNYDMNVQSLIKIKLGENPDQKLKDVVYRDLMMQQLPNLDWGNIDEIIENARKDVEKQKLIPNNEDGEM